MLFKLTLSIVFNITIIIPKIRIVCDKTNLKFISFLLSLKKKKRKKEKKEHEKVMRVQRSKKRKKEKKLLKRAFNSWKSMSHGGQRSVSRLSFLRIVKHYLRPCQRMLFVGVRPPPTSNGEPQGSLFIVAATMV